MDALTIGSIARVVLSLALVVGMLLLVRRWAMRSSGSARNLLRVVARAPLGRNASVAVVELGDRHYLVGVAEENVSLLDRIDDLDLTSPSAGEPAASNDDGPAVISDSGGRRSAAALFGSADTDDTWPRTGLVDRMRRMTLRAPGRVRGDAFEI